jgi:2,3-bisphosphoglycerate-independent phosphoglycerate mutase
MRGREGVFRMSGRTEKSVILFFIDGLGIGPRSEDNPLFLNGDLEPLAYFDDDVSMRRLSDGGFMVRTDPRLFVEGRPQSASGQTTILTGKNAPQILGFHKQGFPNAALREVINEHSLFLQLKKIGHERVLFANAYTPQFFQETPRWKSATTVAVEAAGLRFRRLSDLLGRKALFHDFTNRALIERGFDVPPFSESEAAEILASLAAENSFVLYEHFLTDKIGHDRDFETAARHLPALARFVRETLRRLDPEKTTFILTSDHGNIEDLSVRNHTLNDVPTIVWGRRSGEIAGQIKDLTDITPAVLRLLTE